ncbi:hypothetical protein [Prosthecobacter sp.]|uniref:hypothetical protein n=1 Tax=Prosthecobacter sp. TaxID=1965333 RepID=UPI003784F2B1
MLSSLAPQPSGLAPVLSGLAPVLSSGSSAAAGAAPESLCHPLPEVRMMPRWNDGSTWNSGALWGPAAPASPLIPNPKRNKRTMKRQPYYPKLMPQQPEWHHNFASKLPGYATALGLDTAEVNAAVADNLLLAYALGDWITNVRNFAPSCTSALEDLTGGNGSEPFAFPAYAAPTPPALPSGITEVAPGALDRTFLLVKEIKGKKAYNETMGLDLRVVEEEDAAEHPRPEFALKTEAGDGCHCVKVRFKKFGHYAVAVYSKRGSGGWELLGIDSSSPYEDDRPLLVAGQPEIREYKLRFWDAGEENGDWTDVASITVSL